MSSRSPRMADSASGNFKTGRSITHTQCEHHAALRHRPHSGSEWWQRACHRLSEKRYEIQAPRACQRLPCVRRMALCRCAWLCVATGDVDSIVGFCWSFLIVERMRFADSPQLPCRAAVSRIQDGCPDCPVAVVAVDYNGRVAGAALQNGFRFVRRHRDSGVSVFPVEELSSKSWTHSSVKIHCILIDCLFVIFTDFTDFFVVSTTCVRTLGQTMM